MRTLGHLDLNIVTHCNMRCAACSHFSPFSRPWFMKVDDMARDLAALKPFLRFEQICLVGGEPTLHPDIVGFIQAARESGLADRVTVITNGKLLPRMTQDFWVMLRPAQVVTGAIRLSVYGALEPATREFTRRECEKWGIPLEEIEYDAFYRQFKPAPDDGVQTWSECHWRNDCWTAHEGRLFFCPQSAFLHKLFPAEASADDGLPLADLTEDRLNAFLDRTVPLRACSRCCGGHGQTVPWQEAKTKKEWMEKATI